MLTDFMKKHKAETSDEIKVSKSSSKTRSIEDLRETVIKSLDMGLNVLKDPDFKIVRNDGTKGKSPEKTIQVIEKDNKRFIQIKLKFGRLTVKIDNKDAIHVPLARNKNPETFAASLVKDITDEIKAGELDEAIIQTRDALGKSISDAHAKGKADRAAAEQPELGLDDTDTTDEEDEAV